uniref:Uncharacterized protein n=1 Tax=Equus caballus TaxID=9796 RepID=A0A9L0TDZ8_HORSE
LLRLHLSPRRRRLARKLLFFCALSLSVTYLCYSLLGGSGTLQFPVVLQEPPSPPPPCLLPPPVRLGTPSQPSAPPPDNASRGEPPEPSKQPPALGADGWGLASGSGGARDTWLRTPVAPGEMITAQSVLLEREAQESSTTHDELAGQRAVNGSSERGGALSTPNYGEKKLPQVLIIGVKKGGTRAAGGDPSPPGGVGGGHRAALLRQELRKGARVVQKFTHARPL